MAIKTTVDCVDLGKKLNSLYLEIRGRPDPADWVTTDAELGRYIGVAKSTLVAWRNGVADKGRPAHQVAHDHVRALSVLLASVTDGRISADGDPSAAYRLWTEAPMAEFRRRLFGIDRTSIGTVLDDRDPALDVTGWRLGHGLGMVDVESEPVEGEFVLRSNEPFELRVSTKPGLHLIVLGHGEGGWFLLAPAEEYRGPVVARDEIVPSNRRGWRISKYAGPHRVSVIELRATTAPVARERRASLSLSPDQEARLIWELTDPELQTKWRWGFIDLFVRRPGE